MGSIRTGRGDDGTTNLLYTNRRVSKTHPQIDLTHALDSYSVGLGQLKLISPSPVKCVLTEIQHDLIRMMGITAYGSDAELDDKLVPQCIQDPSMWKDRFEVFTRNPIPQTIEGIELCQTLLSILGAAYSQFQFLRNENVFPSSQVDCLQLVFDALARLNGIIKIYLSAPTSISGNQIMAELSAINGQEEHPVEIWRMWSKCLRRSLPFLVDAFPQFELEFECIYKLGESVYFIDFERGLNACWFSQNSTKLIQGIFEKFQGQAGPLRGWIVAGHNTVNFMAHELRTMARTMESHLIRCYPVAENPDLKEAYRFFNILSDLFFCLAVMSENIADE